MNCPKFDEHNSEFNIWYYKEDEDVYIKYHDGCNFVTIDKDFNITSYCDDFNYILPTHEYKANNLEEALEWIKNNYDK